MLISPAQHDDLMLGARLHLELVLTQEAVRDYQLSVLGVFNIAVALAHHQKKTPLQQHYEAAQLVMVELIQRQRPPDPVEGYLLRQTFNEADRYIGFQTQAKLVQAIEFASQLLTQRSLGPGTGS